MSAAPVTRADATVKVGAWIWVLSLQFFVAQGVVASVWAAPFSLRKNAISDLGNTTCAALLCSPWHAWMNASFVLQGLILGGGALLCAPIFLPGARRTLGLGCVLASGLGVILVGLFPEDTSTYLHLGGALTTFLLGNLAPILLTLRWPAAPRWIRRLSVVLGSAGLIGLLAVAAGWATRSGLWPGFGSWERLTAYPLAIWAAAMGAALLRLRKRTTVLIVRG